MTAEAPLVFGTLTREALSRHLHRLIAIDGQALEDLGLRYSDERWDAIHFELDLPGKWDNSVVATAAGRACGFWVAALRASGQLHTHRVAVDRATRGSGVGSAMFERVRDGARRSGIGILTLTVAVGNEAALDFYRRRGFVVLEGQAIADALGNERGGERGADYYVTPTGHRNHLLIQSLQGEGAA